MFEIRPAKATDKEAVLAFCRETFTWGDYIPHVYDEWLADPNGELSVATVDGVPVALSRVRYLSPTEAWFEGLRVNPALRRQGLGKAIAEYNQALAIARGIKVGRAFIAASNVASQTLSSHMGFVQIAEYRGFDLKHPVFRPTDPYTVRPAIAEDMPHIVAFMRDYPNDLLSWHWHAQQVSEHALQCALQDNALWVALLGGEVCCVCTVTFWEDKEMDIVGCFADGTRHAEAVVQHMVNEHLAGRVGDLSVFRQHDAKPHLDLARHGFEPDPDSATCIWEIRF